MLRHLRREDGALSAEFAAAIVPLTIVLAFGWQLLLFVAAGNSAAHAARNGSRAAGISGVDCLTAVEDALPQWLPIGAPPTCGSTEVTVDVDVPLLFPGFGLGSFDVQRSARLPQTAVLP